MKIKLIANPTAGKNTPDRIRQAAALMTEMGAQVKIALTTHAGHAEELARNCRGIDRLVAAGGDGTVNEVINGMMPNPLPLAVIPLGTANVLALETGLPKDLASQCELAVHGAIRRVTLGRAGKRYFLLMAGAGLDGEVVRRVNFGVKRWLGKGAYLLSGLRVLGDLPSPLDLQYDSRHLTDLAGVIICNGRMYGGKFNIAPQASLFSPTLQVIALPHRGPAGLLALILRSLLRGGLAPEIQVFEAASIKINGNSALQLDGDAAGRLPCLITACPAALPLIMTKEYSN